MLDALSYWRCVADDEGCYVLTEETATPSGLSGLAKGYVLRLGEGLWRWRTEKGEGTAATCDDAMDAAEDSLEER